MLNSVVLQANYTFGMFEVEIFTPLVFGATIVVLPPGHEADANKLSRSIIESRVTHATFVTSALMESLQSRCASIANSSNAF